MRAALAVLMLVAGCATAGEGDPQGQSKVFRGKNGTSGQPMTLRIFLTAPCEHPVVRAHLTSMGAGPILDLFKAARLTWDGKVYAGCWWEDEDRDVLAVYEDGSNLGYIPMRLFRDESI